VWERDCPEAVRENRIEFAELDFFTQVPVKDNDIYYVGLNSSCQRRPLVMTDGNVLE
jgi:hypothetical protein